MKLSSAFTWLLVLLTWLPLSQSAVARSAEKPASAPFLHTAWTDLLHKYVTPAGLVDYDGLLEEEDQLDAYLQSLRKVTPDASWPKAEAEAFWLNVYNAATVYTVLQYYPISSINEIRVKALGGYKSVWEAPAVNVGGKTYSLNAIEKEILVPQFRDPRVHLALVCAAVSSPPLLNEAYDGARLNQQLDAQARLFLTRTTLNDLSPERVRLSSLFDWYAAEFGEGEKLVAFLNRYSPTKINPTAQVEFLSFNWGLNNQKQAADTQALRQR